jgi:hypothetical protein
VGPVSFLTPLAALVALIGLAPVAVFLRRERRAYAVRRVLRLAEPPSKTRAWLLSAIVATAVLAGIAAAQPVIDRSSPQGERTDAEIFFALDTSRSMLAAEGADRPTRLERAHDLASAIRSELPEVPAGIAQFTDWTVPHLFPTVDPSTFRHVLERSVYVESLGSRETDVVATDLNALAAFAGDSYFSPEARKRALVVLTDGESPPVDTRLAQLSRAGIRTAFVHVWDGDESIWRPRGAEPQYRPDRSSRRVLAQAAALVDGAVLDERQAGDVVRWARSGLGEGPTRTREKRDLFALMPYVMLAAALPLGLLLRSRNL